jgi:hypothetical protein
MLYSEVRSGFDQFIQISLDFLIDSFNAPITPDRFFSTASLTETIANLETPFILSFEAGGQAFASFSHQYPVYFILEPSNARGIPTSTAHPNPHAARQSDRTKRTLTEIIL